MIEKQCEICGSSFEVRPYRATTARFCNRKCGGKWHAEHRLAHIKKPWAAATLAAHRHKSTSRFKPGHSTWNAGAKGLWLSTSGQFPKGNRPHNEVAIGVVRIRRDKHGTRRAHVKTETGWDLRARVVWIAMNGAVPAGSVIHHDNENALDDRLENLVCVTRSEHLEIHRLRRAAKPRPEQPGLFDVRPTG